MKNNKVVLVDVDDVVVDLLSAWLHFLNNKYDIDVRNDEITDWDISKFFPTLTKEQIFEPLYQDEFWKTVKPKYDAVEYVKRLFDEGYDIYFCTSTDYRNIRVKYESIIKKYFPYIKWSHVIVAYRKQMIKADFLIDDSIHNLENGDYNKLLMSMSHNLNYDAKENGMIRVNNWNEIYKEVNKL